MSRIVAGQRGSIRSCYERELRNNPNLAGRLEMRVTIGPSGRVTSVSRSGLDVAPNVGGCVSLRVRALVFPPPERGDANFNFSWNFAPGG